MEYTKEEIILIGNATYEASCKLNIAYELFDHLIFDFFEDRTLYKLIEVATHNPDRLHAFITVIFECLFDARVELDTFVDPNGETIKIVQSKLQDRQKILDTFNNNLSA